MEKGNCDLVTLASLSTSRACQQILIGERDPRVLRALAHARVLHPDVANDLAVSRDHVVATRALRAVSDASLFARKTGTSVGLEWACRNPSAPQELLERGLDEYKPEAACNPSTPEELRRVRITTKTTPIFTHKTGSTTYGVARNHELAAANPWALETASAAWAAPFRRGLSALPQATRDNLIELGAKSIRSARPQDHPASKGVDLDSVSTEDLIFLKHPAADLAALTSRSLNGMLLSLLIRGSYAEEGESGVDEPTLPHIIGRAFNLYGVAFIRALDAEPNPYKQYYRWPISGTRARGAAWIAPGLTYLDQFSPWVYNDLEVAEQVLGECVESWRVFVGLIRNRKPDGNITMVRSARAARTLVAGS